MEGGSRVLGNHGCAEKGCALTKGFVSLYSPFRVSARQFCQSPFLSLLLSTEEHLSAFIDQARFLFTSEVIDFCTIYPLLYSLEITCNAYSVDRLLEL